MPRQTTQLQLVPVVQAEKGALGPSLFDLRDYNDEGLTAVDEPAVHAQVRRHDRRDFQGAGKAKGFEAQQGKRERRHAHALP